MRTAAAASSPSRRRTLEYLTAGAVITALVGCGKSQEQLTEDLLVAARNGDTETIKSLIAKGVNVNSRRNPQGWTALHYAASGGYLQIVELLLKAGADAHASGDAGGGIVVKPRVTAQAGSAMVGYLKGGKVKFEASPQGGLQATDDDAVRRYDAIVELLAVAEKSSPAGK